jgi:AraC-like DNA-binding protein
MIWHKTSKYRKNQFMQILDESPNNVDHFCQKTMAEHETRLEKRRQVLKVPAPEGLLKSGCGHYHFTPEVFAQIAGTTEFECPHEHFFLKAGEIGVLATGLPHLETPRPQKGLWMTLVVCFSPTTVSCSVTGMTGTAVIKRVHGRIMQTSDAPMLIEYLTGIAEVWHATTAARDDIARGLMLAFLARLRAVMVGEAPPMKLREAYRVLQCRHYGQENMADPGINVTSLAKKLNCSSDYLSHLFRRETGMTLTSYIMQLRVMQAKSLLKTTALNVQEVGRAVGYEDPVYFIRVFRKLTGLTPKGYRNNS